MSMTKLDHNRLAEGEATGHYHEAVGPGVQLLADHDGSMVLDAPEGAEIVHQEHKRVTVPAARYERRIAQEFNHFTEEASDVED